MVQDASIPYLQSVGFETGLNDRCVMIHRKTKVRLGLHVDDTLARGPRKAVEEFFAGLRAKFEHKEPTYLSVDSLIDSEFVGIHMTETIDVAEQV